MTVTFARFARSGLYVFLLVAVGVGLFIWHNYSSAGGSSSALSQNYCSSVGKVCFSYPQAWHLHSSSQGQATVTDPKTGAAVQYSPQTYSSNDPCAAGVCLFKTLSVIISNGFAGANDVAGVFESKAAGIITPQYFLMSTKQLDGTGLSVGTTTDVKQTSLNATFVNGSLTQFEQSLMITPPASMHFANTTAAQNWLSSPAAETAEAIVNSARPEH